MLHPAWEAVPRLERQPVLLTPAWKGQSSEWESQMAKAGRDNYADAPLSESVNLEHLWRARNAISRQSYEKLPERFLVPPSVSGFASAWS